jgi:hypothetical protein
MFCCELLDLRVLKIRYTFDVGECYLTRDSAMLRIKSILLKVILSFAFPNRDNYQSLILSDIQLQQPKPSCLVKEDQVAEAAHLVHLLLPSDLLLNKHDLLQPRHILQPKQTKLVLQRSSNKAPPDQAFLVKWQALLREYHLVAHKIGIQS